MPIFVGACFVSTAVFGALTMWTGEGFLEAIVLIYIFAGVMLFGPPLLFGHLLLQAAKLWSYRAYMVFGLLMGPALLRAFTREPMLLIGALLGGVSALALRGLMHTPITDRNNKSILQGRFSHRPLLACFISIVVFKVASFLMQYQSWQDMWRWEFDRLQYLFSHYELAMNFIGYGLTVWLTRWLQLRFSYEWTEWRYVISAMLSVGLFGTLGIAITSVRLGELYLYWSLLGMCSTAAGGWVVFALYENLTGIRDVPVKMDHENAQLA